MRCLACNALLDDAESTNKSLVTGEYLDMCRVCLYHAGISSELEDFIDRGDTESYDDEVNYDDAGD